MNYGLIFLESYYFRSVQSIIIFFFRNKMSRLWEDLTVFTIFKLVRNNEQTVYAPEEKNKIIPTPLQLIVDKNQK